MKLIKHFIYFLRDLFKGRELIWELTKKEFMKNYLGSYLGLFWAFIQPAITIMIFWFVFQIGFKSQPVDNFPFILWLLTGMVPWFFFSNCIASASTCLVDNSFLIKKVVFRVSILPIVKIFSQLIIHGFFIIVIFVMFGFYGYRPDIYSLQIFYYLFASIVLALGVSWITSSLVIFIKDVDHMVSMILQFMFWSTPVFWTAKIIPEKYRYIIKLNPAYYLVEGYRDSMIYKVWFWERYNQTPYYWIITIIIFFAGALLFRRLRPHFADVL